MPTSLQLRPALDPAAREACREALAWEGPGRVLTLTVDARDAARPASPALHAVERELEAIGRRAASARGSTARIAQDLRADVHAAQAHSGGAGFAVFADLETGTVLRIPVDRPLPTRVTVGARADVRPLVRALHEAQPAGVVRATAERVELGEWAPAGVEGIVAFTLPPLETPDLRGPSAAHPRSAPEAAPGSRSSRQHDLHRARIDAARRALAGEAAGRIAAEARERAWPDLVLAGEGEITDALLVALPPEVACLVVRATLPDWRSPAELGGEIASALAATRRGRAADLLAETRTTALRGGHAVLGVEATLEALAAGRVRTLLLPVDAPIAGHVASDGSLEALRRGGPAPHEVDDRLADAMIRVALVGGADVALADALEAGEAAALLRW